MLILLTFEGKKCILFFIFNILNINKIEALVSKSKIFVFDEEKYNYVIA